MCLAVVGTVTELTGDIAMTDVQEIRIEDIPQHLLNELSSPDTLPVKAEISSDRFEREIIYRTLIDLKNDVAEIKELLLTKDVIQHVMGESREVQIDPMHQDSDTLEDMERQAISEALKQTGRNRRKTAKLLGIGERTLYRKLKQYGLY